MMQCEARVVKAEGGWESRGWVSRWRVMGDGIDRMGESVSSCTLARSLARQAPEARRSFSARWAAMYGSSSSMQRVQGSVVDYCSSEVRAAVLFLQTKCTYSSFSSSGGDLKGQQQLPSQASRGGE